MLYIFIWTFVGFLFGGVGAIPGFIIGLCHQRAHNKKIERHKELVNAVSQGKEACLKS